MTGKDKLFFGLVIFCILMIAGLIFYVYGQAGQCLKNPFIYGASHNVKDAQCSCTQAKPSGCPALFSFNSTGMETPANDCGTGKYTPPTNFNLTGMFEIAK